MKLFEKLGTNVVRKTVLATALMSGVFAFFGASSTSAAPRVIVSIGGPVLVHRGYYAPPVRYYGPAYVAPRFGYVYYHGPRAGYWDARFHCWRYR